MQALWKCFPPFFHCEVSPFHFSPSAGEYELPGLPPFLKRVRCLCRCCCVCGDCSDASVVISPALGGCEGGAAGCGCMRDLFQGTNSNS